MVKAGLITGFKIKLEEIPGADVLSCLWKLWLSAFCIGFLIMRKKEAARVCLSCRLSLFKCLPKASVTFATCYFRSFSPELALIQARGVWEEGGSLSTSLAF